MLVFNLFRVEAVKFSHLLFEKKLALESVLETFGLPSCGLRMNLA